VSFWQKLFGGGKPGPAGRPAPAADTGPDEGGPELPYGIGRRPMPQGEDLDVLLPPRVGSFTREPVQRPATRGMPIYANYRRGGAAVFVELGICDSPGDAQSALETAEGETGGEFPDAPRLVVKRRGASCLRTVNPLGAFVAWTRGRYYFSAHAKGGEPDLDEFMAAFPY
jgi:hypothetical protein